MSSAGDQTTCVVKIASLTEMTGT